MLLNYKCDISKTKATVSASVTKFNSNYVYKRTAYSSFLVTGIASVKLPGSTICFIKRIASYFIHCILCQITRYFFFWPLCCLFFFDYEFWLLLWHPQNLLTYEIFFTLFFVFHAQSKLYQTRLRRSEVEDFPAYILLSSIRCVCLLRHIYFSNGDGSFSFFV